MQTHQIDQSGEFCACGQDTAMCQVCGRVVCAKFTEWVNVGVLTLRPDRNFMGNVCRSHVQIIRSARGE